MRHRGGQPQPAPPCAGFIPYKSWLLHPQMGCGLEVRSEGETEKASRLWGRRPARGAPHRAPLLFCGMGSKEVPDGQTGL